MRETVIKLLRQQPFHPFVVQMSNGQAFEIRHPEMAAVQKSNLIISCADSDNFEICSFLHMANAQTTGPPASGTS